VRVYKISDGYSQSINVNKHPLLRSPRLESSEDWFSGQDAFSVRHLADYCAVCGWYGGLASAVQPTVRSTRFDTVNVVRTDGRKSIADVQLRRRHTCTASTRTNGL
jgi:hypothetical protein